MTSSSSLRTSKAAAFAWAACAAALVLLVGTVVLLLSGPSNATLQGFEVAEEHMIPPERAARIPDAGYVQIARGDQTTTLVYDEEHGWTVDEFDGFPANETTVTDFLGALSRLRAVQVSQGPADAERTGLGSNDLIPPERITVHERRGGERIAAVTLGNALTTNDGTSLQKTFVQVDDDPRAWINDGPVTASAAPADWINREILHFPSARIETMEIEEPAGEKIVLIMDYGRVGIDTQSTTRRGVIDSQVAMELPRILENFLAVGARRADETDAYEEPLRISYGAETAVLDAFVYQIEGQNWIRFDPDSAANASARSLDVAAPSDLDIASWLFLPERPVRNRLISSIDDLFLWNPDAEE